MEISLLFTSSHRRQSELFSSKRFEISAKGKLEQIALSVARTATLDFYSVQCQYLQPSSKGFVCKVCSNSIAKSRVDVCTWKTFSRFFV